MKLLEINKAILEVLEKGFTTNEETGEVFDLSDLESLNLAFEEKVDGVAYYIKNNDVAAKALKEEAKTLLERAQRYENRNDKLKKYLLNVMDQRDMTKIETTKNRISTRKSTSVVVDDEMLPKKYLIKKVDYKPDKKMLKELLNSGKRIKGAELEQKITLYVK
ncbi:siphovirus Gp157 family protein [Erysipelotrichaceae bacterium 66-17]